MFLISKKNIKRYREKISEKISCKKFKTTETCLNETMFENQERQKYMC